MATFHVHQADDGLYAAGQHDSGAACGQPRPSLRIGYRTQIHAQTAAALEDAEPRCVADSDTRYFRGGRAKRIANDSPGQCGGADLQAIDVQRPAIGIDDRAIYHDSSFLAAQFQV